MMVTSMVPVTLSALEGFFAIAFFLIAFVGWIVSLANQHQPPQKRGPGRGNDPQRRREVQGEIDEFLTQSRRNRPRQNRRDEFVSEEDVEIVEPPKRRPTRRPPPQGQQRSRTQREIREEQTRGRQRSAATRSQKSAAAQRSDRSRESSFDQSMSVPSPAQLAQQAAQDVAHPSEQPASNRQGQGLYGRAPLSGVRDALETTTRRPSPALKILPILQSQEGIRNAVLLTEILSKPRGLQRRG